MSEIITFGLNLAKNVFQVHGTDGSGRGEAVDQYDADMDFGGLAVGISCSDAFPEGFEAAHLRLDPASIVVSCPAHPGWIQI